MQEIKIIKKPWGYEQILPPDFVSRDEELNKWQKKILVVYSGGQLSYQSHKYRDERWKILSGKGEIRLDDNSYWIYSGTIWHIIRDVKHSVKAIESALVIEEISTGDKIDDNDITRYEDIYGRVK